MVKYTIQQGDCLSSIAKKYNMLPMTIWNAGENASLKAKRLSPNVLLPGDILTIPDCTPKEIGCATDQEHKFVRQGATCKLRVRFRILKPDGTETKLSNEAFTLEMGPQKIKGNTDGDGGVRKPIDADARGGSIRIRGRAIPFTLGALDPHDEISGIQARLNQCGFNSGKVDGIIGPKTESALKKFQEAQGLPVTGNHDQQTINALKQLYGG